MASNQKKPANSFGLLKKAGNVLHVLLRNESALSLNYLGEGGKPKANSIHTLRKYPLKENRKNMVLYINIYAALRNPNLSDSDSNRFHIPFRSTTKHWQHFLFKKSQSYKKVPRYIGRYLIAMLVLLTIKALRRASYTVQYKDLKCYFFTKTHIQLSTL